MNNFTEIAYSMLKREADEITIDLSSKTSEPEYNELYQAVNSISALPISDLSRLVEDAVPVLRALGLDIDFSVSDKIIVIKKKKLVR